MVKHNRRPALAASADDAVKKAKEKEPAEKVPAWLLEALLKAADVVDCPEEHDEAMTILTKIPFAEWTEKQFRLILVYWNIGLVWTPAVAAAIKQERLAATWRQAAAASAPPNDVEESRSAAATAVSNVDDSEATAATTGSNVDDSIGSQGVAMDVNTA